MFTAALSTALAMSFLALGSGDAISIAGVVHNARDVGEDQAFLLITFSSAHRETVKE